MAGHSVAVVPAVPRWAGGVLPAMATRAACAGSVHAAQAVTAAGQRDRRPGPGGAMSPSLGR
jgi:hypothetical protein